MHSQRMASIAPIVIGCIDYLAYGAIFTFTRAMFRPKIKIDFFFAGKAIDEHWEVVYVHCGIGRGRLSFRFAPSIRRLTFVISFQHT